MKQLDIRDPRDLIPLIEKLDYVIDEDLATVLHLMMSLEKPLLLEGNPGVGKTAIAYLLSDLLEIDLLRLQCYEGIDVNNAIYEWNYQKQLLAIKMYEQEDLSLKEKEESVFSEAYLMSRPLLQAIQSTHRKILLIDEIDRADEEFEAFLLELLSDFQISIPEFGTVKAKERPLIVLTSNRTRELSDALKRRCLYSWIPYPDMDKELKIVNKHVPALEEKLTAQIVEYVHKMRKLKLEKMPGVAETIDWARGVSLMDHREDALYSTLACILKTEKDKNLVIQELFT